MTKTFSELVIEGPFMLIKGFLVGYLYGSDSDFKYFFHRKAGIRRETLGGFIKEIFEFENFVHLCVEDSVVPKFVELIENSHVKIGLVVK